MTDNAVLDVALGLMAMFLCLSLLATVINEMIAMVVDLRAATLADGIAKLLDDSKLKSNFEGHGLVQSARAVAGDKAPSYLSSEAFAMALLGSLNPAKPVPGMEDIEAAIESLGPSAIKNALQAHFAAADGRVDEFRNSVARWYDQSMDRVGGIYKRKVKVIGLFVAAVVATAFNADAIHVADALWRDSALRAQATAHLADLISAPLNPASTAPETSHRPRDTPPAAATVAARNADVGAGHEISVEQLRDLENRLRPLPLGWHATEWSADKGTSLAHVTAKVAGIVVTILAISLGAPFWFDVLNKFANVRGVGIRPPRAESS